MAELLTLASSVAGATSGSEYLDFAIQRLFGLKKPIPAYTRSLDAAMQLVPEAWSIHRMGRTHDNQGKFGTWRVELYRASEVMIDASIAGQAATAPLAVCAAALRALDAMQTAGTPPAMALEVG
jgi:hypothetical protein